MSRVFSVTVEGLGKTKDSLILSLLSPLLKTKNTESQRETIGYIKETLEKTDLFEPVNTAVKKINSTESHIDICLKEKKNCVAITAKTVGKTPVLNLAAKYRNLFGTGWSATLNTSLANPPAWDVDFAGPLFSFSDMLHLSLRPQRKAPGEAAICFTHTHSAPGRKLSVEYEPKKLTHTVETKNTRWGLSLSGQKIEASLEKKKTFCGLLASSSLTVSTSFTDTSLSASSVRGVGEIEKNTGKGSFLTEASFSLLRPLGKIIGREISTQLFLDTAVFSSPGNKEKNNACLASIGSGLVLRLSEKLSVELNMALPLSGPRHKQSPFFLHHRFF
ncbi:MAG: uncharacterized protein A8A55_2032 [Amphiamblys sp. WSBS2006]|nr:MAG: uncharacterized protein A8A55_2032 [Amphiamblys sp. WSBS2006]